MFASTISNYLKQCAIKYLHQMVAQAAFLVNLAQFCKNAIRKA